MLWGLFCPRSSNCVFVMVRRVFLDCLINPLQEQMEEWKRVANTLDKDHAKGTQTDRHTEAQKNTL